MKKSNERLEECKKQVFARLDAIDRGEVPRAEVGTLVEEAASFDIIPMTLKSWGKEWVADRHGEVPAGERAALLAQYCGSERRAGQRTR